MRHLIDIAELQTGEIDAMLTCARDIAQNPERYRDACRGKQLAALFFEPSTRTRLSFESAMLSLGGGVLSVSDPATSSAAKGESVGDTVRVCGCYADIVAMRHPREGAALAGAMDSSVPLINGGDGSHNHPTQTLGDLLSIVQQKDTLSGLHIGLCGDLKYGRTVHSLVQAMARYDGVRFTFLSPRELAMPDYLKQEVLDARGVSWRETESLQEGMQDLDVLYMTRIQRERFSDAAQYERLKDSYILDKAKLCHAPKDMTILHPLPRVNEIATDVDGDPRAYYFEQALCGKYMRMALMLQLLEWRDVEHALLPAQTSEAPHRCANPRCITAVEEHLPALARPSGDAESLRCVYCEAML